MIRILRPSCLSLLGFMALTGCEDPQDPDPEPDPVPATVELTRRSLQLAFIGDTADLDVLVVRDSAGEPMTGFGVSWMSTSPDVATVDGNGLVAAVAPGEAYAIARVREGVADSALIRVVQVAATLELSTDSVGLDDAGDTAMVTVLAHDSAGHAIDGVGVLWISSNHDVVTVSEGVITARGAGSAIVRAIANAGTSGAISDSVRVTARIASPANPACADPRAVTPGGPVSGRWTTSGSPRLVRESVTIAPGATLTIDPGVTVCFAHDVTLTVRGTLVGTGSAGDPVLLTAMDTLAEWRGIETPGPETGHVTLTHVEMSHARLLRVVTFGELLADNSIFRLSSDLHYEGRLNASLVEDAVVILGGGVFEETTIRRGRLVALSRTRSVSILGGRIEDAPAAGIEFARYAEVLPPLNAFRPVRIVRAADYPAMLSPQALALILAEPGAVDSMIGNAVDELFVLNGRVESGDTVRLPAALPLRAENNRFLLHEIGLVFATPVVIEAGATLHSGSGIQFNRPVFARGTPDLPVRLRGDRFRFADQPGATSRLEHIDADRTVIEARDAHALAIETARIDSSRVLLDADGSLLRDAHISAGGFDPFAWRMGADPWYPQAVRIGGAGTTVSRTTITDTPVDGILVTGTLTRIEQCTIAGNGGHAISVADPATLVVRGCNLHDNAGDGVANASANTVDARENWWGDPAGPAGPAGDGVSGPVDASAPLTQPATF